jgi:hypothetical protein
MKNRPNDLPKAALHSGPATSPVVIFFILLLSLVGCQRIDQRLISPKEDIRQKARDEFRALNQSEQSEAARRLANSLDSESADSRRFATESIGALGTKYVPEADKLLARALKDKEPSVRREAISGLAPIDGAIAQLAEAVSDADKSVRQDAIEALGKKGAAGIAPLLSGIQSADADTQRTIAPQLIALSLKNPSSNADIASALRHIADGHFGRGAFSEAKFWFEQSLQVDAKNSTAKDGVRRVELAIQRKNRKCNEAYEKFSSFATNILLEGASKGGVMGADVMNVRDERRDCQKACAEAGVNCAQKWGSDAEEMCGTVGSFGYAGEGSRCNEMLSQLMSRID